MAGHDETNSNPFFLDDFSAAPQDEEKSRVVRA
jgi:hypothetical protein